MECGDLYEMETNFNLMIQLIEDLETPEYYILK
jgi:hypothetical protein